MMYRQINLRTFAHPEKQYFKNCTIIKWVETRKSPCLPIHKCSMVKVGQSNLKFDDPDCQLLSRCRNGRFISFLSFKQVSYKFGLRL